MKRWRESEKEKGRKEKRNKREREGRKEKGREKKENHLPKPLLRFSKYKFIKS